MSNKESEKKTEPPVLQLEKLCLHLSKIYPELNFVMSRVIFLEKKFHFDPSLL